MNLGGPDDLTFSHPEPSPEWYPDGLGPAEAGDSAWGSWQQAQPSPVTAYGGRYEPRRLLGRGGMAEVHLAHDTRLDRGVAVKTLRADLAQDPTFQARFRREAQSAASLNHPAIAAVYDTGEEMAYGVASAVPLPYLVMEYVDGMTLREILYSGPALTLGRVLEIAAGVLQALAHSHHHGIVHRDIKPANVMLTHAGQVKVMDFGIARDLRDVGMTQSSVVIGTAQYLSPEQALGEEIDARSDLYSVGCLLYELLTYRPPFTGDSPMAVMYQHIQEVPQPPSLYNPEIGPRLDATVLRALAKDRAYRYRSAEEMLADVTACLGTGAFESAFTTGAEPGPEPGPERPYDTENPYDPSDTYDVDGDGGEEAPGGSRRAGVVLAVAGVVVVGMALVLGWFLFGRGTADDGRAEVPNLVGRTLDDARRAADNSGLTVTVAKRQPCDDQPKGYVCEQTPTDGELAEGEAVSVTVSTGAPKVEVPDVTDKNEDDATRILQDKGFKVKVRHVESTEHDAGTVLTQDPEGGAKAEKGTEITLGAAKAPGKAVVPDLTGLTPGEARELLAAHGLKLGNTTEVDSSAESGTVVGQSVAQGEEVASGSAVDVQVAKAEQTVRIPTDIVGRTLAEVQDELGGLGLKVSVASGSSQASDAVVTSTTPQAGSEVTTGSTVIVATEEAGDQPSDGASTATATATSTASPSTTSG
ncbi:Stk1 family PASTA domain-containing Ser/Thr kinase [Streptomyces sp. NPDC058255]|uniref:Stk1 family PASTA domain-containing Ser/Thr kinase n=1 Tax=Streptomyces sp. NPDC058255 TaxID=3346407 RepID=UPI0036EB5163